MCSVRDIPLIFLQNTPPDNEFLSAHGNDGITVKARAQMIAAVACTQVHKNIRCFNGAEKIIILQVPKLTVVLGGGYGPSYYAMVRMSVCLCVCQYQSCLYYILVLTVQSSILVQIPPHIIISG